MFKKIQCSNVSYRKGCIEITPGIHDGCVNLETWTVHPEIDLTTQDIRDDDFPDDGVTGNTEIELSATQVRDLIRQLQHALEDV